MVNAQSDCMLIYRRCKTVKLKESDWCFQRYIWQAELDAQKLPEVKVIKTLIYGVRSSGNLSERSIRETTRLSKDEYPYIHQQPSATTYT